MPVVSIAPEDAPSTSRGSGFLAADARPQHADRELLGWEPTQPGLIDDLDKGHYFHPLAQQPPQR